MKNFWQFEFYIKNEKRTRYFRGTEAAVGRRVRRYDSERKNLVQISKSKAEYLKTEKKARFIDL